MSQYLKWILKVKNTFSVFKIKLFIHVKCLEIVVGEKVQYKQSFRWLGSFGKHFKNIFHILKLWNFSDYKLCFKTTNLIYLINIFLKINQALVI